MTQTIIYTLICINVVTFLVYGIDKWKAKQGSWRISEATLLLLAVIGGSIGALLGINQVTDDIRYQIATLPFAAHNARFDEGCAAIALYIL